MAISIDMDLVVGNFLFSVLSHRADGFFAFSELVGFEKRFSHYLLGTNYYVKGSLDYFFFEDFFKRYPFLKLDCYGNAVFTFTFSDVESVSTEELERKLYRYFRVGMHTDMVKAFGKAEEDVFVKGVLE